MNRYDGELREAVQQLPPMCLQAGTLPEVRAMIDGFYALFGQPASPPQVVTVHGVTGARPVELRIYRPVSSGVANDRPMPAIYDIHGGGFVLGSAAAMDGLYDRVAQEFGAVVIAPDYCLAPEAPFPAPHDDCRAGLEWILANSASLGIDPRAIVIRGESAGGGLSAGLTLALRDSGEFTPAGLMLLYPMLDCRTGSDESPSANPHIDEISWSLAANRFGWESYRGPNMPNDRLHHFSPALAASLDGMPPTFIGVGSLDLFVDECTAFAVRLLHSGTALDFHVYPGAPHGFDVLGSVVLGKETTLSAQFLADQKAAFRRWTRDRGSA